MAKDQSLYFIAIMPPSNISDEVTRFKQDFVTRFNARAALKNMPHITLKAPFIFPRVHHEQTLCWFENMQITVPSFKQELRDFDAFHNRRSAVIFVKPVMNVFLDRLQKQVLKNFGETYSHENILKQELDFKPHMTIAYRDLQPNLFKEAWKEYETKKYAAGFDVNNFRLLQHNGKAWNIISTYNLP